MIAAANGNINFVNFLLLVDFDVDYEVNKNTAADYAFNSQHGTKLDIIYAIIEHNGRFPKEFDSF
jgi:hypothetical protein